MESLEQILSIISSKYPKLYKEYLEEEYLKEHGPHFTEDTAKEAVSKMFHHSTSGFHSGEHWNKEQIERVKEKYKDIIAKELNCWDIYVALHMWWHDLESNYRKHGILDEYLIDDAMHWAFKDEDAKEGKIWYYINAML